MGRSAHPIDRRADVYGLAAVLRFLLFRVLPADALPARPELPKRVHEGLIAVLERGLDPDPSRRQDTAGTLAEQARAVLADHMRRMRSFQRIRRAMAGAAAVFALGGVGYVVTDGGRDGETDSGDTVINSAVAPRDDFRALDPVLDEAALAFKYLNEQVIESDEAAPAELLSRNDAVIARRKAVIARLSELRLTSDAAQRTETLAIRVLRQKLDYQKRLRESLRELPEDLAPPERAARYAEVRAPLRPISDDANELRVGQLTDAYNELLIRAGEDPVRELNL